MGQCPMCGQQVSEWIQATDLPIDAVRHNPDGLQQLRRAGITLGTQATQNGSVIWELSHYEKLGDKSCPIWVSSKSGQRRYATPWWPGEPPNATWRLRRVHADA